MNHTLTVNLLTKDVDRKVAPAPSESLGFRLITNGISELEDFAEQAEFISASSSLDVETLPEFATEHIVNRTPLNKVRFCNKLLEAMNDKLPEGGYFVGRVETNEERSKRLQGNLPKWLSAPRRLWDFCLHRVAPKLVATKKLYFYVTKGQHRVFSRAEVLGRLVACGFEIVREQTFAGHMYFVARKASTPAYDLAPSYGPIFKMRRVGQGGRTIYVYKLRTMHPYAEYLQSHVYEQNKLDSNGKLRNDYRITPWGKVMRRLFLDELPMLINLLKGDMKLVGVRPISEHYLGLYPSAVADKRVQFKPGLIPPFYLDLPKNLEEIVASEARYLDAYEKHPWKTDMRYFLAAMYNILVKRARSQ